MAEEEDVKLSILMDEQTAEGLERAASALERMGERWGRSAEAWRATAEGMGQAAQTSEEAAQRRHFLGQIGQAGGETAREQLDMREQLDLRNRREPNRSASTPEEIKAAARETAGDHWKGAAQPWQAPSTGMGGVAQVESERKRFMGQLAEVARDSRGPVPTSPVSVLADEKLRSQQKAKEQVDSYEASKKDREAHDKEMAKRGHGPTANDQFSQFNQNLSSALRGGRTGENLEQLGNTVGGVMGKFGKHLTTLSDSTLTSAQQMQQIARDLPIIGGLIAGAQAMIQAPQHDVIYQGGITADKARSDSSSNWAMMQRRAGIRQQEAEATGIATERDKQHRAGFAGLGVAIPDNVHDTMGAAHFSRQIETAQRIQDVRAEKSGIEARKAAQEKELDELREKRGVEDGDKSTGLARGVWNANQHAADIEKRKPSNKSWVDYVGNVAGADRPGRTWNEFGTALQGNRAGRTWNEAFHQSLADEKKPEDTKKSHDGLQAHKDFQTANNRVIEKEIELRGTAADLVRKQGEELKALAGHDKDRLSLLRQQEGVVQGQVQSFGSLTKAQQSMAIRLLEKSRDRGFDSLSFGERNDLRRYGGGQVVDRGIEKMMDKDPDFKKFQHLIADNTGDPTAPRKGLGEIRTEARGLEIKLAETRTAIEASTTKALQGSFAGLEEAIVALMSKVALSLKGEITMRTILANMAKGGM